MRISFQKFFGGLAMKESVRSENHQPDRALKLFGDR